MSSPKANNFDILKEDIMYFSLLAENIFIP